MDEYLATLAEHEDALEAGLEALPRRHSAAFAAACAERLWPAYALWAEQEHAGDAVFMRRSLDAVWAAVGAGSAADDPAGMRERAFDLTPDTEEFGSGLAAAASNAGAAIVTAIDCLRENRPDQAASAAALVLEVLDESASEHDAEAELARQRRDLGRLTAAAEDLDEATTRTLRADAEREAVPLATAH